MGLASSNHLPVKVTSGHLLKTRIHHWPPCVGVLIVAEPINLMPPRSARLSLDTKHPRENTKLLGSVGHTTGENPKIHIFAIRITNERIKLTIF